MWDDMCSAAYLSDMISCLVTSTCSLVCTRHVRRQLCCAIVEDHVEGPASPGARG